GRARQVADRARPACRIVRAARAGVRRHVAREAATEVTVRVVGAAGHARVLGGTILALRTCVVVERADNAEPGPDVAYGAGRRALAVRVRRAARLAPASGGRAHAGGAARTGGGRRATPPGGGAADRPTGRGRARFEAVVGKTARERRDREEDDRQSPDQVHGCHDIRGGAGGMASF